MTCFKPATPGFIVTLVATGLLAVVSFGVPLIKSVYFLKATVSGFDGDLTFGTLGYCLTQGGTTTCSKATVGYELDINALLGNNTKIQLPNVVVKWITYCLVLHIVALVLSGISAIFGLIAHCSEFAGTCCSTCVAGFSAGVAFLAFVFDLVLFFLTKSRINNEAGGAAKIGNAIWLTVAAWVLLLLSGLFYCCGSCCVSSRPNRNKTRDGSAAEAGHNPYADQMRMDAIKAESDRKNRVIRASESGLPAFQEYQPLTHKESIEEEHEDFYEDGDKIIKASDVSQHAGIGAGTAAYDRHGAGGQYAGGYAQAPPGTRAVDEYYSPVRQQSGHTMTPSSYSAYSATPPMPQSQNSYFGSQSSYQPASASPYPDPGFNPASLIGTNDYYNQQSQHEPQRSYTLGGGGYGESSVPDTHNPYTQSVSPPPGIMRSPHSPGPHEPASAGGFHIASSEKQLPSAPSHYDDNPPVYDEGLSQPPGQWGAKS